MFVDTFLKIGKTEFAAFFPQTSQLTNAQSDPSSNKTFGYELPQFNNSTALYTLSKLNHPKVLNLFKGSFIIFDSI